MKKKLLVLIVCLAVFCSSISTLFFSEFGFNLDSPEVSSSDLSLVEGTPVGVLADGRSQLKADSAKIQSNYDDDYVEYQALSCVVDEGAIIDNDKMSQEDSADTSYADVDTKVAVDVEPVSNTNSFNKIDLVSLSTPYSAAVYRGDSDLDSIITVLDATNIQKYLVNSINFESTNKIAADVNADKVISVMDATIVQRKIALFDDPYNVGEIIRIGDVVSSVIDEKKGNTVEAKGSMPVGASLSTELVDNTDAESIVSQLDCGEALFACDIKILDSDGNEWDPETPITITINNVEIEDGKDVGVLHLLDTVNTVSDADDKSSFVENITDVTVNDNSITFETSGFSTFIIYTVDFHYGDVSFSIEGESSVLLSKVFTQLNIDKSVSDVKNVAFSTLEYLSVKKDGSDWLLTSLAPFTSLETLTITFDDGEELVINVTDSTQSTTNRYQLTAEEEWGSGYVMDSDGSNPNYTFASTYGSWNNCVLLGGPNDGHGVTNCTITIDGHSLVHGTIVVYSGCTLNLQLRATQTKSSTPVFKRMIETQPLIYLEDGAKLNINTTYNGEADIYFSEDNDTTDTITTPMIMCESGSTAGSINVNHARFRTQKSNKFYNCQGMAFYISGAKSKVSFNDVTFIDLKNTYSISNDLKDANGDGVNELTRDTLTSAVVFENTTISNGVSFTNCSFSDCYSYCGCGVGFDENTVVTGDIKFEGCNFTNCESKIYGGGGISVGVVSENYGEPTIFDNLYVNNCTFDNCKSTVATEAVNYDTDEYANGAGVAITKNAEFSGEIEFTNSVFRNLDAYYQGGALYIGAVSNAIETTVTFPETSTTDPVYTDADLKQGQPSYENQGVVNGVGDVTVQDVFFTNCCAGSQGKNVGDYGGGGAIYVDDEAKLDTFNVIQTANFQDGLNLDKEYMFYACQADDAVGGAIYVDASAIIGTDERNNTGTAMDDGYYTKQYGIHTVKITDVNFNSCTAPNVDTYPVNQGGAVYLGNPTDGIASKEFYVCDITHCDFDDCYAHTGGAIATSADMGDALNIVNCDFNNCYATANGGAIKIHAMYCVDGDINITGCTFNNCHAVTGGGAIFNYWQSSIEGININNSSFNDCYTNGTSAASTGGAISNDGDLTDDFVVTNTQFNNCYATSNGGAISLANTSGKDGRAEINGSVIINNSDFTGTADVVESGADGGAIYIDSTVRGDLNFENSNFIEYDATNRGGAICIEDDDNNIADQDSDETIRIATFNVAHIGNFNYTDQNYNIIANDISRAGFPDVIGLQELVYGKMSSGTIYVDSLKGIADRIQGANYSAYYLNWEDSSNTAWGLLIKDGVTINNQSRLLAVKSELETDDYNDELNSTTIPFLKGTTENGAEHIQLKKGNTLFNFAVTHAQPNNYETRFGYVDTTLENFMIVADYNNGNDDFLNKQLLSNGKTLETYLNLTNTTQNPVYTYPGKDFVIGQTSVAANEDKYMDNILYTDDFTLIAKGAVQHNGASFGDNPSGSDPAASDHFLFWADYEINPVNSNKYNNIYVSGCTFDGNDAIETGGAVNISGDVVGKVEIKNNSSFKNATSHDGGAVQLDSEVLKGIFVNNTTFESCTVGHRGAGVLVAETAVVKEGLNVTESTFKDNKTTDEKTATGNNIDNSDGGAGVCVASKDIDKLIVSGSDFNNCRAEKSERVTDIQNKINGITVSYLNNGGAILVYDDCVIEDVTINNNSTFTNCYADIAGGAVAVNGKVTGEFTVDNSQFDSCEAVCTSDRLTDGGGALCFTRTSSMNIINVSNSRFNDCIGARGGAIRLDSMPTGDVDTEITSFYGANEFNLTNSTFKGNKTTVHGQLKYDNVSIIEAGGAVAISDTVKIPDFKEIGEIYVDGCSFEGNDETTEGTVTNEAHTGGGISIFGDVGTSVDMSNCSFKNLQVSANAGAVKLDSDSELVPFTFSNITFEECSATTDGGAIQLYWESECGSIDLSSCKFDSCDAKMNGGAVSINGSVPGIEENGVVKAITITDEVKDADDAETKWIDESKDTFTNCNAIINGGAISIFDSTTSATHENAAKVHNVKISGAKIKDNTAGVSGGGVYIDAGVTEYVKTVTVTDNTEIKNNVAGQNPGENDIFGGGAIALYGDKVEVLIEESDINVNSVNTTDDVLSGYGGAVLINGSHGKVTIDCETTRETKLPIHDNKAQNGGAVAVIGDSTSVVDVIKGNIVDNTASGYGGGVYVSGGDVKIQGGNIERNCALNGGAVAVVNGGDIHMTDGFVRHNKAVYNETAPTVTTTYQNHSDLRGVGGGIYIADGLNDNTSTYTLEVEDDTIGIYSNLADFAADDVFANGKNTQLTVPDVEGMNLEDYKDSDGKLIPVTGWFEDYANDDTEYENMTADRGSAIRFRSVTTTHEIPVTEETEVAPSSVENHYTNTLDSFICMTLGTVEGKLTVNVKWSDESAELLSDADMSEEFAFRLTNLNETDITDNYTFYYSVVDESGNPVEDENGNKVFSVSGSETFTLLHGQTAVFDDVTLGEYRVEEVLTDRQKTFITTTQNNTDIVASSGEHTELGEIINGLSTGDDVTVKTMNNSEVEGRQTDVKFVNNIRKISVDINYYLRNVVSGKPADMGGQTTYTVDFVGSQIGDYYKEGVGVDFEKAIEDAYADLLSSDNNPDNVIDEYVLWTTQNDAVGGLSEVAHKTYEGEVAYHTNQYGNIQQDGYWTDSSGASTDSEADYAKWVTYYDYGNYDMSISETPDSSNAGLVCNISIWLFNKPKEYTVNYYSLEEGASITAPDKTVAIGDGTGYVYSADNYYTQNAYYNQRLGIHLDSSNETQVDSNTHHLSEYNLGGYTNSEVKTAEVISVNGTPYYFQYWAFKEDGTEIASTDVTYNYRMTKDITLYPVYANTEYTGCGVTAVENHKDYFYDGDTQKVRLNTIINPYGFPDYDSNIKETAVVYVRVNSTQLTDEQISAIRTKINSMLNAGYLKGNLTLSVDVKVQASGLSYKVQANNGTENATDVYKLTNKNRIQFSTNFSVSSLENTRMFTYTAMNYYEGDRNDATDNWIVSDNYVDYNFLNTAE